MGGGVISRHTSFLAGGINNSSMIFGKVWDLNVSKITKRAFARSASNSGPYGKRNEKGAVNLHACDFFNSMGDSFTSFFSGGLLGGGSAWEFPVGGGWRPNRFI